MATNVYSKGENQWSIFVSNISYDTNEQELHSFFEKACGHVKVARIIYDNHTRRSRGFGFIEFDDLSAYEMALTLNGNSLNGRKLKICHNKLKPTPPPGSSTKSTTVTVAPEPANVNLTNARKTHVVHCRKSNYDVYIGRPSIWGNPFKIGRDGDKSERLRKYREWIMTQPELLERAKRELRGRTIACWCKPEACHGDILAEIIDTN
ncbi:unnamed protein product [Adineta ricciae]|uniref:RRM domain-containing protein n=1 Tax=Adineta ricciae TaxID=249248 RepID=A0A815NUF6_ADIRI|nr:unnamed protein product [Adineta ricciae]CAF1438336.1 unnamed protein product [Adineta ricciae]